MKIKTQVSLGVGFLFLLIILMSIIGVTYIKQLSNDTQNILVANYNTIDYSRQMLLALNEGITSKKSIAKFQDNLVKQQKNITETGEQELTNKLFFDFEKLKANPEDSLLYVSIRKDLTDVMLLNMQAIQRKSAIAAKTAKTATTVIEITGSISLLLAFTLAINLPGSIANPIKELTKSIKEIAAENYTQRVHFENHSEFGELAASFNTMAQKLEEYNNSNLAKLVIEKKRIETLINTMHDPVIGLDKKKKILFINHEALKIIGLKHEETIGKKAQDIAVNNDLMRLLIQPLMLPNNSLERNTKKPLKIFADGKESYFNKEIIRIEITPTAETIAQHIGDVILLQNITSFKELDAAKTNFMATISHELKTPLSSALLSLELLSDARIGEINAEQKQLVKNVTEDCERLLKIIGELLQMTQVETGKIQLTIQPTNIQDIIRYAVEATKAQAAQNKITIEIIAPETLAPVIIDAEKTAWVVTNFISNALRYSHENSKVIVSVKQNNKQVELSVQDFGKGIDAKYKDKVFDRYFRVPGTKKEGAGLGLAISKEFIEAQGGHIKLESNFGTGSIFTILLNTAGT